MKKILCNALIFALVSAVHFTPAAGIEVVSKPLARSPQSFGDSLGLLLSADGHWAAFTSSANGLLPSSGEPEETFSLNVYLKNLESGEVLLLSKNSDGEKADGDSVATGISGDGRFIVFESDATDLVSDDANDSSDIFLFDRSSNVVTRISTVVELDGIEKEVSEATGATVTGDGRYVFFEARVDFERHYFQFDRDSGETVPAVTGPNGEPWPYIENPGPSYNGRFVAFRSGVNIIAPHVSNGVPQLFLHDVELRTNYWLSLTATNGLEISKTNGPAAFVSDALISKDNNTVIFAASDLSQPIITQNPLSQAAMLYLYSTDTDASFRIPYPTQVTAELLPRISTFDISADGEMIVYTLAHLPQAGATTHLAAQLYLYDRSANTNQLLATAAGELLDAQISDDGNRIVFTSVSNVLVGGVNRNKPQLYFFNRESGSAQLLSRNSSGAEADDAVISPVLSADGSVAGFETLAENLATNDDPTGIDLFTVKLPGTNAPVLLSAPHPYAFTATAAGMSRIAPSYQDYFLRVTPRVSADGQRVLLHSSASDLAAEDLYSDFDLFSADLTGSPTRLVTAATNTPAANPLLIDASGDLNRILFGEERFLYLLDVAEQTISPAVVMPDGTLGQWSFLSGDLSIDGRFLLFEALVTNAQGRVEQQLYVRDLETQESQVVPGAQPSYLESFISEGGRYALNSFSRGNPSVYATQVIDLQSGQNTTLNYMGPLSSAWDDSIMLFMQSQYPRGIVSGNLWTYNPVSQQTNFVATNAFFPVMSGDGSTILYSQRVGNDWRSFSYETATAIATPLTVDGLDFSFDRQPSVTPDGRFIAFSVAEREPNDMRVGNLYVFDRVLTNLTTITGPGGRRIELLRQYAISADGRTVVFDSGDNELVPNDSNMSTDTFAVHLAVRDTDDDSIEDGWEIQHFGSIDRAADADADEDGVSNVLEFRTGTDPQDAASKFNLSVIATSAQEVTLEWPSGLGKTYQLQRSTTLAPGSWTDFGAPVTSFKYSARASVPANGNAYYRTRIQ
jgi:Tol biopolymer transport system component